MVLMFWPEFRTEFQIGLDHGVSGVKEQKASNRALLQERILIENIISKLKIFRFLSERY